MAAFGLAQEEPSADPVMGLLKDFESHFRGRQVHLVLDSYDLDSALACTIRMSQLETKQLVQFGSDGDEGGSNDQNVLVLFSSGNDKVLLHELAVSGRMSRGVWLVPSNLIDESVLETRFDSEVFTYSFVGDTATLRELFSVKRINRFSSAWGNWSSKDGLKLHSPLHVWERRMGFLRGVRLKLTHLEWRPFNVIERREGNVTVSGLFPDIFKLFQVHILPIL